MRFEIVPGGHLGMLTGRKARSTTWRMLDEWIDEWSADEEEVPAAPRRTAKPRQPAAKKPAKSPARKAAKKTPATKAPGKQTAKKAPAHETATPDPDDAPGIGINPERRYGSADSRALRR